MNFEGGRRKTRSVAILTAAGSTTSQNYPENEEQERNREDVKQEQKVVGYNSVAIALFADKCTKSYTNNIANKLNWY